MCRTQWPVLSDKASKSDAGFPRLQVNLSAFCGSTQCPAKTEPGGVSRFRSRRPLRPSRARDVGRWRVFGPSAVGSVLVWAPLLSRGILAPRNEGSGHGTSPAFPGYGRAGVIGRSKAELSRTAAGDTRATQPNNLVCGRSDRPRPRCLMRILGEAPRGWAHSNLRLDAHRTRRCTIRLGVPTARQYGSVVLDELEGRSRSEVHAGFSTKPSGISPNRA
jgi:hypothetical protein